ncbi:MAG: RelE-like translational repressor toxin [uncultured Caballeronia sp.]|nr:MAG: RelE-like translational repressor toxin [uncultured Caballeronia sp.]
MKLTFIELPVFSRYWEDYLDEYRRLQEELLAHPTAGDVIKGTGGLRRLQFGSSKRGKGKRSGIRAIYYYWVSGQQVWLFSLYGKDEMDDLSNDERRELAFALSAEMTWRKNK